MDMWEFLPFCLMLSLLIISCVGIYVDYRQNINDNNFINNLNNNTYKMLDKNHYYLIEYRKHTCGIYFSKKYNMWILDTPNYPENIGKSEKYSSKKYYEINDIMYTIYVYNLIYPQKI